MNKNNLPQGISLYAAYLSLLILFSACGAVKPFVKKEQRNWQSIAPPENAELLHSVFLIGDVGDPEEEYQEPSLRLLETQLRGTGAGPWEELPNTQKSAIFLGDNIYLDGLSEIGDPEREDEEWVITEQMKVIKDWEGRPVFVPGNHDWNYSREGGLEAILRQQAFVDDYLQKDNVWLPRNGCPGPYPVNVSDKVVLILLDTEWWLTHHRRPVAPENGCTISSELDMIVQLNDMLDRYEDKHVVLAFHHPLMTNGNHGGHYSLGDHIFPLRLKVPNLYLPLPLIGSIYPLARMYGISRQDIANPKYQTLINGIMEALADRPNVVMASGHEHSLQLLERDDIMQIVSGAGCKESFCVGGGEAIFVHKHNGFSRINFYENGEAWVEFWEPEGKGESGRLAFRMPLYSLSVDEEPITEVEIPSYADSVKLIAADSAFGAKTSIGRKLLGEHYREVWRTPITVPYLDMETQHGGLKPIKMGGGKQTISLRLITQDSIQYNLRSVDKDPAGVLPGPLQSTFVESLINDQLSSAHPYGALAIPPMADAVGVYHTDPKLFYVPTTPSLGPYLDDFGGRLAMLEIRPDEDLSAYARFGFTENAVSTRTMLEKINEDNDDEVAADEYLRARLFDMVIGDWDRHADQWRWAEFEKEDKGSVYHPIPRDRDQVFVKFDGFFPWLGTRKWAVRHIKSFDYEYGDIAGLNLQANSLDRRLLSDLSWTEWEEEIDRITENLTDEVITEGLKQLPEEVYPISAPEIKAKLKERRANLKEAAREYYLLLNEIVDVVGSDKHEQFEIERLPDGKSRVKVYKTKKEGDLRHQLYDRTFDPEITDEIRLYGLEGHDHFFITGQADNAIKVRIIGGEESDTLRDNSQVSALGKTVVYYDNKQENSLETGKETRLRLSKRLINNLYDADEFKYPYIGPRLAINFNVDDGLFFGGGIQWRTNGFRKDPAAKQTLLASYAFATQAYNFAYEGEFSNLIGYNWDLIVDARLQGPQFVLNYFGQGNETDFDFDIDYYRVRLNRFMVFPRLNYQVSRFFNIGFGPQYRYIDVARDENRNTFIDNDEFIQSEFFNLYTSVGGGEIYANLKAMDHPFAPDRGIQFNNSLSYSKSLDGDEVDFWKLRSDFRLYISPNINFRPTISVRFGGERIWGDYLFFQSATIGQSENLRGFRRFRFAGNAAAWQNTEVRIPVSQVRNYIFTGNWGVYGFIDHARVWTEDGDSDKWHRGYGPGLFLNLYRFFILAGNVSFSDEGPYFQFDGKFFF